MKISLELPLPLKRDYQPEVIKNIYWLDAKIVSACYETGSERVIHIEYADESFPDAVRANVENAACDIINSIDKIKISRVFDSNARQPAFSQDPLPFLEDRGWVQKLFAGGYSYRSVFLQLMKGLDATFRDYALSLGSEEFSFPGLLAYPAAERCGYVKSYPQNANLVSHVHEDLDVLRNYKAFLAGEQDATDGKDYFAEPDLICAPTVCHHFWQSLADREHDFGSLKVGTAVGPCHRFESRATTGLERLREFRMREMFAIGSPPAVAKFRDRLLEGQKRFLEEFAIAGCIETATDPFFIDTYATKRVYQVALNLKYEVKAVLPYKDEYLAIGSVNYHENFFSKAFNISDSQQTTLHSCCLGFGLERWCLAIFAQHGLEPEKWPKSLQAAAFAPDASD